MHDAPLKLRVDKWLWQARFFKSRALATAAVTAGRVRVNQHAVKKSAHLVAPGDQLTFAQAGRIRVIEVLAIGHRRGPASEAQALYRDLAPEPARNLSSAASEQNPRPSKKQRRQIEKLRNRSLE